MSNWWKDEIRKRERLGIPTSLLEECKEHRDKELDEIRKEICHCEYGEEQEIDYKCLTCKFIENIKKWRHQMKEETLSDKIPDSTTYDAVTLMRKPTRALLYVEDVRATIQRIKDKYNEIMKHPEQYAQWKMFKEFGKFIDKEVGDKLK